MGLGLGESEPAAASAWPLDWTVAGVPEPSILFQLKGAADWAQASQNLGSLGSANDAVAQAGAVVPVIGANGAIF
ncbi:MAG: hypothetical protein KDE20_29925, partial [Caldilineaceae bacterium]|nr:hypothetical protein [Caldilineaceae bacterium]